jgi:hypothetical protein
MKIWSFKPPEPLCNHRRDDLWQVGDWECGRFAWVEDDVVAKYYLHLHECDERIEDEQGFECDTLGAAEKIATDAARDMMAEEVRAGRLCISCYIAIEDAAHNPVSTVRFGQALVISGL